MITRNKIATAYVNMLKSYDTVFYGRNKLVQSIVCDPLQFTKSRADNRNQLCVYFSIDETLPDVIASQNHYETYLMDCTINVKYSNRINSIDLADNVYEYIKKYTLDKEYSGLSLSEYYTDTNSSVISMTPIESSLPPPDEENDTEINIFLDSAIEFYMNIW